MLDTQIERLAVLILFSMVMLIAGLYLLTNFSTLFRYRIKNEVLRRNLVVWMIGVCFIMAITPTSPEFYSSLSMNKLHRFFILQLIAVTCLVLFVFNITWFVSERKFIQKLSFKKKMAVVLLTIIVCTISIGVLINFCGNHGSFKNIEFSVLFNFYTGCMTGLIYIAMSYAELARKQKLDEKELELSRLRELKTKAELDALHSKINPHFLYNALNSIADLSITDGKKARKMTIALGDLFRYSINHSNHNYSPVKDEVEMAEVYLQIEKIRFEDQLTYSVKAEAGFNHYLLPRFILQPIVENAVKHGLKATGKMTEIQIEVARLNDGLLLTVADNGPLFPDELSPGYGVKSIFDKLDLLFPNQYEVRFTNEPRKQVAVHIQKLMKDEPVV